MDGLKASKWAATPPPNEDEMPKGLVASRWADEPTKDEKPKEKPSQSGMPASRWADTPPPQDDKVNIDLSLSQWATTPSPAEDFKKSDTAEPVIETKSDDADQVGSPHKVTEAKGINGIEPEDGIANGEIDMPSISPQPETGLEPVKSMSPVPEPQTEKARLAPPKLKKRVSWRGKTCIVSIPDLDYSALGLQEPMDSEDFQMRLLRFEQEGYDIHGFDLGHDANEDHGPAHVRAIFPNESETRAQAAVNRPSVLLPDLNKWKAYQDALTEAKLAALGVSFGPSEPELEQQTSHSMSRQSSAQYPPLPFSPPLPTASAGSIGPQGRPGMIRGHSHTMSVASPISPLNGPFGHMHRHSTFHGGNSFFPPQPQPMHQQQQQQHPGMPGMQAFSPVQQFNQNEMPRIGSPALMAALRNELGNMRGPGSPLSQQIHQQPPQQFSGSNFEQSRSRGHSYSQSMAIPTTPNSLAHFSQPPSLRPTPALPDLQEAEDEGDEMASETEEPPAYVPPQKRAQYNADIAVPSPKGHRHNISENLERDVLETEKRQKRDIGRISDIEPNEQSESDLAPIMSEKDPLGGDATVREAQHKHKKTMSRSMNASAPAFTFNPTASFTPQAQDFEPKTQDFTFSSIPLPQHAKDFSSGHIRNTSSGSFNPSAAIFKPSQPPSATSSTFSFPAQQPAPTAQSFAFGTQPSPAKEAFNFGEVQPPTTQAFAFGAQQPAQGQAPVHENNATATNGVPTLDFSFTAQGPELKDAPRSFEPSRSDDQNSTPIFGKFEIPDIVKPTRKSKAVAIVRPEYNTPKSSLNSENEDSDGRAVPSSERMKRSRRGDATGDSVPQFAEPTPEPELPKPLPEQVLGSNVLSSPVHGNMVDKSETIKEEPEETGEETVKNDVDAPSAVFDQAASKAMSPQLNEDKSAEDAEQTSSNDVPVQAQQAVSHSPQKSSLSAVAHPFVMPDFNFDLSEATAGAEQKKEKIDSLSDLEDGEIRESDASPIASPKPALKMPIPEVDPSFDEIDAVMQQLNDAEAANGPPQLSPLPSPDFQPAFRANSFHWTMARSERGPSASSPEWMRGPSNKPKLESPLRVKGQEEQVQQQPAVNGWPPVNRLNNPEDVPMSDWSGMLSTPGEDKLRARSNFFDSHIENVIGRAIAERLQPLEETLRIVQNDLTRRARSNELSSKRRAPSTIESDADDEEDSSEAARQRPISRGRDKRLDQMKSIMLEALREQGVRPSQTYHDIADLHSALADIKVSFARAASANLELDDIRQVVEKAVGHGNTAMSTPTSELVEEQKHQIALAEGRVNEALANALEEANMRNAAEERDTESRRLLRLAEEELRLLRDTYRDNDSRLQALEDERDMLIERAERAEDSRQNIVDERDELHERLRSAEEARQRMEDDRDDLSDRLDQSEENTKRAEDKADAMEAGNAAMQATLKEYRLSSDRWRHEIEDGNKHRVELEDTIAGLENKIEEGQQASAVVKRRLEKLSTDMANAAGQLATEKAAWRGREDDYRRRCEALEAQRSANARERTMLEDELRASRSSALEFTETKIALDHTRQANQTLEDLVRKLQLELSEQQSLAARWERDFQDARESGRAEIQRTRMALETEVEAANHQVNIVRADLEGELSRGRAELENVKMEMDTAKARHEMLLEESEDVRRDALRKVNHTNSVALDEVRQKHDLALQDLTAQHSRTLTHALEDRKRSEIFYQERLSLAEEKVRNEKDRVALLEERLEVAKSAAQAAVRAQSKPATASFTPPSLPERISPQALRESILVLQDQLQERETTIENLQSQNSSTGKDLSTQLKEKETEIGWLRELLAVRHDDLSDLVSTLTKPSFDRDAVRNTAIRISANIQMEQQEKERVSGTSDSSLSGQAFASLSSFATPKLTSAFNTWRSSMESSSLKNAQARTRNTARQRSNTPSKAPSAPGPSSFLNGLMTPPASNVRRTPSPQAQTSLPAPRLVSRPVSKQDNTSRPTSGQEQSLPEVPTTPTLFREQTYDEDAENSTAHLQTFDDEDLDVEDTEPPAFRSLEDELEEDSSHEQKEEPAGQPELVQSPPMEQ